MVVSQRCVTMMTMFVILDVWFVLTFPPVDLRAVCLVLAIVDD